MKKTVLAAGIFDIIHPGHIHYLTHAKSLGEKLIVVVGTDEMAARLGKSPVHSEGERLAVVGALKPVDETVLGDRNDMLLTLKKVSPDIVFLGHDQRISQEMADYCKKGGIEVIRDDCASSPERHKTSKIKERIAERRPAERLFSLTKTNVEHCPWCSGQTSEGHMRELLGEVDELKAAFEKGDYENVREELGDVLWDALVLAHICEREGKFRGDDALLAIIGKIERRKPWLIEGREVSREDAERIWKEAKGREKAEAGA